MAMYWDKEHVAIEIIDDEEIAAGGKYPLGTLINYVGASQVNDPDLVRCLQRLVAERGIKDDLEKEDAAEKDDELEEEIRREERLWEAELQLARNLTGEDFEDPLDPKDDDDEGWGIGDEDEGDQGDAAGDEPDQELESMLSKLGLLGCYAYGPVELGAKKIFIENCGDVRIR